MRKSRVTEEQIIGALKQMVADQALDLQALKAVLSRKW
jgi:hypothetical protein